MDLKGTNEKVNEDRAHGQSRNGVTAILQLQGGRFFLPFLSLDSSASFSLAQFYDDLKRSTRLSTGTRPTFWYYRGWD